MSDPLVYLIDSDVLITAKNRYYAFSICPGFWDSLLYGNAQGLIRSIDQVKQEILFGSDDDPLVQWVKSSVPADFFGDSADSEVVEAYREIMMWAQRQPRYTDAAKAKFASGADGWLVAYSRRKETVVVTNEQPAPDSQKAIKLPDICNAFGVPYEDTFSMLSRMGFQYYFSRERTADTGSS